MGYTGECSKGTFPGENVGVKALIFKRNHLLEKEGKIKRSFVYVPPETKPNVCHNRNYNNILKTVSNTYLKN